MKKKVNTTDKILKLRQVLDINISIFWEGLKNFKEFMKAIITPLDSDINIDNKLTTKNLISRVIKYLEKDCERRNYWEYQSQSLQRKDDFIADYSNNIIYTYIFSNLTSKS